MYKGTSDSKHFIERTGSHSTKGSRGGRVTTLPPEAQPHEEAYLEMKDQLKVLEDRRAPLVRQKQELDDQLKDRRLTPSARQQIRDQAWTIQVELKKIKSQRNKIRKTQKYAGLLPYCIVFFYIAEKRLDDQLFAELDAETRRTMGRRLDRFTLNYESVRLRKPPTP